MTRLQPLRSVVTIASLGGSLALGILGSDGCAAVPDLRFVADDAGSDGPSGDAAPRDGAPDVSVRDAAGDAGSCTGPSPAAGAVCCGSLWCVGQCDAVNCRDCAQKALSGGCAAGDLCCGKTGTVLCKKTCP